jgi:hypothetical protein
MGAWVTAPGRVPKVERNPMASEVTVRKTGAHVFGIAERGD